MVQEYESYVETVSAIPLIFDNLKEIYMFLGMADITFNISNRILSAIITNQIGLKLSVQKNDFIVKSKNGIISVMSETDFNKKYKKKEA